MVETLSRMQFAFTVAFHFLFVPLTIGLILLVAIYETMYFNTKNEQYKRMSNFWSDLFLINYVIGVVTGLTMSVQFGTNWAPYAVYMGDIFGSPLAIEAILAFFLEATFSGIWFWKRNTLSRFGRLFTVWAIMIATCMSGLWIIAANGFMHHPVGFKEILLEDGTRKLILDSTTGFIKLVTNPYVIYEFTHTISASFICGAIFVIAVSAFHLKNNSNNGFYKKSITVATIIGIIFSLSMPVIGISYAKYIGRADVQPLKGAILLGSFTTKNGEAVTSATIQSASSPTSKQIKEDVEELTKSNDLPNAKFVNFAYNGMKILGYVMIIFLVIIAVIPKLVHENKLFQNISMFMVPVPFIAISLGWIVTEVGRQPWIVYRQMKVADAISNVDAASIVFSLVLLVVFYAILAFINLYLMAKYIKKGPEAEGGIN